MLLAPVTQLESQLAAHLNNKRLLSSARQLDEPRQTRRRSGRETERGRERERDEGRCAKQTDRGRNKVTKREKESVRRRRHLFIFRSVLWTLIYNSLLLSLWTILVVFSRCYCFLFPTLLFFAPPKFRWNFIWEIFRTSKCAVPFFVIFYSQNFVMPLIVYM